MQSSARQKPVLKTPDVEREDQTEGGDAEVGGNRGKECVAIAKIRILGKGVCLGGAEKGIYNNVESVLGDECRGICSRHSDERILSLSLFRSQKVSKKV
jgi:hypothetical protein